jgi:diketogulonate reductase-like aldo/keto reductase
VKMAVQHGYRSIDTAAIYENEEGVGQGIRDLESQEKTCLSHQRSGMPTTATNQPWLLTKQV